MNCLGNVLLLPRKKNESKRNKRLDELSDELRQLVSKFADVKLEDFGKYSNVKNIGELVAGRKAILINALDKREEIVLA